MAAARLTSTDWLRDSTGHPADAWFDPVAADEVRSMITTFAPDAVVLGGFAVHPYGAVVAETGVPVILDHQNVEADLAEETAALAAPAPHVMVRRLAAERTAIREAALVASVDRVWTVSERDAVRLQDRYPETAAVDVLPNVVDELPLDPLAPSERGSPLVLYPGALGYPPNADAARWLVHDWWPLVRPELDQPRLVIAGSDPPAWLRDLDDAQVEVTGMVDDLDPWFRRATLLPVPLRAGGGTRLKVLEALAHRVPVISTSKGCEGLDVVDGTHLLLADDLADWRSKAVEVHRYSGRFDEVSEAGRALVEANYTLTALSDAASSSLVGILGRTPA